MTRLPRPSLGAAALAAALLVLGLSLVIAPSGASYAGALAKGVVGTAQLKKGAVTSAKVKDGSLTAADFAPGQLPAGPKGAAGPTGPTGPKGERGPSDLYETELDGFGSSVDLDLPLPAGAYFVTARVGLFGTVNVSGQCHLASSNGTGGDMAWISTPANKEGNGQVQALLTLTAAGNAELSCPALTNVSYGRVKLDAIAVSTTHVIEQP